MKTNCLIPVLILAMTAPLLADPRPPAMGEIQECLAPVQESFREISFLNLLNGLYLSTDR